VAARARLSHEVADGLFNVHAAVFGTDLPVYRGHVHRVIGLVGAQCDVRDALARPLGVAAFFHDAGIWFDNTWNYLPSSIRRATAALDAEDQRQAGLVSALIAEHHRLRPAHSADPLVEAFRRADLTDLTASALRAPGVSRQTYRALVAEYPARGFRPLLLRAFGRGLREDPLHPAPMLKL